MGHWGQLVTLVPGAMEEAREPVRLIECVECRALVLDHHALAHVCAVTMAVNVAVADYRQAAPRQAVDVLDAAREVVAQLRITPSRNPRLTQAAQRLVVALERLDS